MPKAFSPHEKEIIRARLLEEAYKRFSVFGFEKTSVEDLIKAVSISKGAFYLFYASKEELFMDVVEKAEEEFRSVIISLIEEAAESSYARLKNILLQAFSIWKTAPILQTITKANYDRLIRKLPPERVKAHLESDRVFIEQLVECCIEAGIPITAGIDKILGLVNALYFVSLHEEDFGPDVYPGTMELMIDMVTAYCLGELPSLDALSLS